MKIPAAILAALLFTSTLPACKKETAQTSAVTEPKLIIKLTVDPNQVRLGNTGAPDTIPGGHAAQNPLFNKIATHYIEFAPTAYTPLGGGAVLYHAPETAIGGANAIDFSKSIIKTPGENYLEIPLKNLAAGSYEWVRLSLSYQNYDVQFNYNGIGYTGTLSSFVGFNTYITDYKIKSQSISVNANKLQGYWGFETIYNTITGQSPSGATTVPNPLFATSPIPQGSCVVTGKFASNLVITGKETKDVVINMSLSINKSFEWNDTNGNGKWDVDTGANENVVNMGLRGLVPKVE